MEKGNFSEWASSSGKTDLNNDRSIDVVGVEFRPVRKGAMGRRLAIGLR